MITLGIMSGTSMDGLDLVLSDITIDGNYNLSFKIIRSRTYPYSSKCKKRIHDIVYRNNISYDFLDNYLGKIINKSVVKFLKRDKIDLICSHGQTVSHQDGISTIQIGDPHFLSDEYGVPVVHNFRQADIDIGGNGAPLMPFLDWLLFKDSAVDTVTLNLGGMANISYIPSSGIRQKVIGFDTGPGMSLIDETCQLCLGIHMDSKGIKTSEGMINEELLNKLMLHNFINKEYPKSTGRHEFGIEIVQQAIKQYPKMNIQDLLRTFCMFTAKSIAINLEKHLDIDPLHSRLIISGGGIHHQVLMSDLKDNINIVNIDKSDTYGIESEMKESLLMAVLAVARMQNIPANMPTVSGADKPTILGKIFQA